MSTPSAPNPLANSIFEENRRLRERIAELERERTQSVLPAGKLAPQQIWRYLLESLPAAVAFLDVDLRVVAVNRRMAALHGCSPESHAGRTVDQVMPAIAHQARQGFERVLRQRSPWVDRDFCRPSAADATQLEYWSVTWFPIEGPAGILQGVGLAMDEITAQNRPDTGRRNRDQAGAVRETVAGFVDQASHQHMEMAMRENEDRFHTLSDSIPQLAWMADETGSTFWYNRRWYDYTGTTLDEMAGWDWRKVHHPDHVERVVAHFKRCLDDGSVWEDTFPLRRNDGEYRWFLSRAEPIRDSGGRVVRWLGTNTDITERLEAEKELRASEERFRRLYDANIIGIISVDSGRIIEANEVFLQLLGSTREDLQAGRLHWNELTPPEYRSRDEQALAEMLVHGSCKPYEQELARKDGSRVAVLLGATLLERSPLKRLCYILDLTERKELQNRLFEKQKLECIGVLAGGIAHDFNNILVGVIGNASLAQEMLPAGHPATAMMEDVVKAGERAAHLTKQMLAYSGKGQFFLTALDLSAVVGKMDGLLRPSIPNKICLQLELESRLPAIEADHSQLQQVIINLVLNAVEAIGPNHGLIQVRTGVRVVSQPLTQPGLDAVDLGPGNYVYLEIRDTGCGMEEATRSRIFEPFFSTKFMGRGLGLAAVGGVIRAHAGTIQVESQPGAGSCFTILFPVSKGALPDVGVRVKRARHAFGTVLVVDDESTVRETARRALERHGYQVVLAASAAEAIDAYRQQPGGFAMVILDLSMPRMSGPETLPALNRIRPNVPVVISSGYSESEVRRTFQGQTVSGFLQKPYTSNRLLEVVDSILE